MTASHHKSGDVAHAVELVRALRVQLAEMTSQLAWIERQDVTGRNARACAMRIEAAALRRDINEAQILIDRLQRRYLNANKHNEQRRAKVKCQRQRPTLSSTHARHRDHRRRTAATGPRVARSSRIDWPHTKYRALRRAAG
jgi:hypothetical protein